MEPKAIFDPTFGPKVKDEKGIDIFGFENCIFGAENGI